MAAAKRRHRSRPRTTVHARLKRSARYAHDRLTLLLTVLSAVCLLIAMRCLQLIGPPPRFAIEALWVHERRELVRVMIASMVVALSASALAVVAGRRRLPVVALWSVGALLAADQFSDRLSVILRVVIRQVV